MFTNIDYPRVFVVMTIITGLIWLYDKIFWQPDRRTENGIDKREPHVVGLAHFLFPLLFIVLIIRAFLVQPYVVPTGSLKPTVKPGDFLFVNKFAYQLQLPVWHTQLARTGHPKTGDIIVFRWPVNPTVNYVKRVIGRPGDKISYVNKELFINGKAQPQTMLKEETHTDDSGFEWSTKVMEETLNGKKHKILIRTDRPAQNFYNLVVPKHHLFMMGDNRDNSDDSRFWGFVDEHALQGKAFLIWFSWDNIKSRIRFSQIGNLL